MVVPNCDGSRVKLMEISDVATTSTDISSSSKILKTLAMKPGTFSISLALISTRVTWFFSTSEVTAKLFFLVFVIKDPIAEILYEFLTLTGMLYSIAGFILKGWRISAPKKASSLASRKVTYGTAFA